jgi:hypothetical protein
MQPSSSCEHRARREFFSLHCQGCARREEPVTEHEPQNGLGHFHAVQFYSDAKALCGIVGGFLAEGLDKGEPAIVIATPAHTLLIETYLASHGLDVAALKKRGDLATLDAARTLETFMIDGVPNASLFRRTVGETVRDMCLRRHGCTLRAYGEMVDLLWKDGLESAAIRVETLWNQLANTHDFKLLCGYSMGNFYKGAAIEEIKGQHSHLTSPTGEHASLN